MMARRLVFLTLLLSWQAPAAELLLTLTESPPRSGVITTKPSTDVTLRASAGQTVHFSRTAGHDYRQGARGGPLWAEVQSVPRDAQAFSLTPTLAEDGSFDVVVDLSRKQDDETVRYSSTLNATPGVWVKLFGPASTSAAKTRVYSTVKQADEALYLRIDLQ